jgi:FKBP-type peptidyl-prolyl cis-trans isomerase SlyD
MFSGHRTAVRSAQIPRVLRGLSTYHGAMRIERDRVVALEYILKDDDGRVIDTNEGAEPLFYLHGHHNIVPGLERALEGKEPGDACEVTVEPADGYGERDEAMILEVARTSLPEGTNVQRGARVQFNRAGRGPLVGMITKVKLQTVTVDANHELAGKRLHFAVRIQQVRKATREEMAHGHAHGPGHHH